MSQTTPALGDYQGYLDLLFGLEHKLILDVASRVQDGNYYHDLTATSCALSAVQGSISNLSRRSWPCPRASTAEPNQSAALELSPHPLQSEASQGRPEPEEALSLGQCRGRSNSDSQSSSSSSLSSGLTSPGFDEAGNSSAEGEGA